MRCPKNTERGAGKQERVKNPTVTEGAKNLLEIVRWWLEEGKKKQMCPETLKAQLYKGVISDRNGNMRKGMRYSFQGSLHVSE